MANIAVFIETFSNNGGFLLISGSARVDISNGDQPIVWAVNVNYTDSKNQINQAIENAAITAAQTAGFTIDGHKLFVGGEVTTF